MVGSGALLKDLLLAIERSLGSEGPGRVAECTRIFTPAGAGILKDIDKGNKITKKCMQRG
ncbi:hypothetical protein E2C01_035450 [Portunus trituberculatus]|uniref:Uncharacterized protein n=1 Tax=Portunus trituberculatus TaxID=210409 RepID=A0A5B7F9T0_PORTR|nr:hypothetical protein [Portunus trituberculatus]